MKKVTLFLIALMISYISFGQVSGVFPIPGPTYPTIVSAINDLNTSGVGPGGVVFNVTAGYAETFTTLTSGLITATGSASSPVVFQKSGTGVNPVITAAPAGTGNYDYIVCLAGSDYITFDGINLMENDLNLTNNDVMEWGYAILKASATDGSQNVTIRNCKVSLKNVNPAAYGIYSNNVTPAAPATQLTGVTTTGINSYIKIYNDTISGSSNGIYLSGSTTASAYDVQNEIGKDGPNKIINLGSTSGTCYGINVQYQTGLAINQNQINGNISTAFYGIHTGIGFNSSLNISYNTINVQFTGTTVNFYGINNTMGSIGTNNLIEIHNNSISGNILPNITTGNFYGINNTSEGVNFNCFANDVSNNQIGSALSTATGVFNGIYNSGSSSVNGSTWNFYNNTINNNQRLQSVSAAGGNKYLYINNSGKVVNIYNNSVNNNMSASMGESDLLYFSNFLATVNLYGNSLTNHVNGGGRIYGLYVNQANTISIHENIINNLLIDGAPTLQFPVALYGIYFGSAYSMKVTMYNNMMGDLQTPYANIDPSIYGVFANSFNSISMYNNTFYLDAQSIGTNFGTAMIYCNAGTSFELINNILINNSITNGYGHNYILAMTYSNMGKISMNNNNNNLFMGSASSNNVYFTDNAGTNATSITKYRSVMYPRERSSFSENTVFANTSSQPYNLHLNALTASQCESGGSVITSPVNITTDFDNDMRYPNSGYPQNPAFAATSTDVGADEFAGITIDIIPPIIDCTPLQNTSSLAARVIEATITDLSGIPQTAIGLPRLYWKKNSDTAWNITTATPVGNNKYSFTFGNGVTMGDTINYYIAAQDNAPVPNIGGSPISCVSGFTANPPFCDAPTSPMMYRIVNSISGVFPVGLNQVYTSLTNALADIKDKEFVGPVVLELYDDTYLSETFPINITPIIGLSETNTLTIRPKAGISPVITGSVSSGILNIKGADFVIINGSNSNGNTRNLTWQNTNGANNSYTIGYYGYNGDPSQNCVLKNCIIKNKAEISNATIGVCFDLSGAGGDNDNFVLDNNEIISAKLGLFFRGGSLGINNNARIINNKIGSSTPGSEITYRGISLMNVDNTLIENNEILGNPIGNSNYSQAGIYIFSGTTNTKILRNSIHDWRTTHASLSNFGIYYASDASSVTEIYNNLIYNIISASKSVGIAFGTGGNAKLYHNTIYMGGNFMSPTSTTYTTCISVNSGISALDIQDNILKNSAQPSSANPNITTYAIYSTAPASSFSNLNYNDYFVDGNNPKIGFLGGDQATLSDWQVATGQDIQSMNIDPVFSSVSSFVPTAPALNNTALYMVAVPTDITGAIRNNPTSDVGAYEFGNDPYVHTLSSNAIGPNSATINGQAYAAGLSLTTWFDYGTTTAYGISVASAPGTISGSTPVSINYNLTGLDFATTYHYRARSMASNGTVSLGVDSSFTTLPLQPTVLTNVATNLTPSSATLNGTVNPNGGVTSVTIQYGLTNAYGTSTAATPGTLNGFTATDVALSISGLTPYTTYHYRVVATNIAGTTYGNDMQFTTVAIPSTVQTFIASNIVGINATLNGSVNANYAPTDATFEWGLTTSYGNIVNATPATITGNTVTTVSTVLSGLAPATLYHFRCVGNGPGGTVYGNDISFTTDCPTPLTPGTITGLQSVCKNASGITYSVSPDPLITTYNWTLPSGAAIATGFGTNAITVDFSSAALSGNITVTGANLCGVSNISSLAIVLNDLPAPSIAGSVTECIGSTGNVYTTEAGMTNYVWSVTGGTITAGTGTNSITVTWNTAGSQSVNVNYANSNGCAAVSPVSYPVAVIALPVPTISGANVACESSAYLDYTTEPGMTNYVWDMTPNSGTITQSNTNVTTIFWTSAGAKWVSVTYTNANGCSASAATVYNVTVNPLPGTPGNISGQSTVCAGSNAVAYSVTAVSNATTYVWTLPAGASIATGAGTNSITVNYSANATSGDVSVLAQNSCGDGQASTLAVTVSTLPVAAGAINGESSVCQGSAGVTYSVSAISGATGYDWTVPAGATIASGANTNSITVDFSLAATSGNVTVNGSNSCGTGTPSTMAVTVNTKPVTPVITQNVNVLSSSSATGNQWYKDGIVITGATSQTYTIAEDGTYTVVVTLNGCSSDVSNSIMVIYTGIADPDAQVVSVYPNPTTGAFWLLINTQGPAVYKMEILNSFGAVVYKANQLEVNGTFKQYFDLHELAAGIYTLVLHSDSQRITKKIVIN